MLRYLAEHYGDLASVVGLLVTFVGFAATIRKVRMAEKAAEEARSAARETLAKVGAQLLANEVGTLLQLVREIDAACRDGSWPTVTHRCDESRTRLSQLLEDQGLDPVEREVIREATDEMRVIMKEIVKIQTNPETNEVPDKVSKILHNLIIFLGRVKGRLQTRTLEV